MIIPLLKLLIVIYQEIVENPEFLTPINVMLKIQLVLEEVFHHPENLDVKNVNLVLMEDFVKLVVIITHLMVD